MAAFDTTTSIPQVPYLNMTKDPSKWNNDEVICVIGLSVMSIIIIILFGVFGIMTYCRVRKGESLHKIICE